MAKQLAAAGAFTYNGAVGDLRAPWMGNWYFVRRHPLYEGMPVDQAMGIHYQARGSESNGLLMERAPGGAEVEIVAAYSRDHRRQIGAGTFTTQARRGQDRLPPRAGVAAGTAGAISVECPDMANESSFGVVIPHLKIEIRGTPQRHRRRF